jgi:hypothetical protein
VTYTDHKLWLSHEVLSDYVLTIGMRFTEWGEGRDWFTKSLEDVQEIYQDASEIGTGRKRASAIGDTPL